MEILQVFETIVIDWKKVPCKMDTGAFSSSMDQSLAEGLPIYTDGKEKFYRSATSSERQHRNRVVATVTFSCGVEREIVFSVTDRSKMRFHVIIGRKDMEGLAISPTFDERDPDNPLNVKRD